MSRAIAVAAIRVTPAALAPAVAMLITILLLGVMWLVMPAPADRSAAAPPRPWPAAPDTARVEARAAAGQLATTTP